MCVSDHDVPDRGWYFSAETDVVITGVALVDATAETCLSPVVVLPGAINDYRSRDARRQIDGPAGQILGRAAEHTSPYRSRRATLELHDLRPPTMLTRRGPMIDHDGEPTGDTGR